MFHSVCLVFQKNSLSNCLTGSTACCNLLEASLVKVTALSEDLAVFFSEISLTFVH